VILSFQLKISCSLTWINPFQQLSSMHGWDFAAYSVSALLTLSINCLMFLRWNVGSRGIPPPQKKGLWYAFGRLGREHTSYGKCSFYDLISIYVGQFQCLFQLKTNRYRGTVLNGGRTPLLVLIRRIPFENSSYGCTNLTRNFWNRRARIIGKKWGIVSRIHCLLGPVWLRSYGEPALLLTYYTSKDSQSLLTQPSYVVRQSHPSLSPYYSNKAPETTVSFVSTELWNA